MALNLKLSNSLVNTEANAAVAEFNSGYLRIYDSTGGTGQPATADTAIGSQVLLAELRFAATALGSLTNGVITFAAITEDAAANATGTATWYRCLKSDGTTVLCDGEVGTSGANLNLNTVAIQINAAVSVTSFTHTVTK